MLVFIGWRRIGRICLLAIVLPLAIYGLYAWAVTAPADSYGLNCSGCRVVMEFAVVLGVVCALLLGLSYSAVRDRCEELGIERPPRRSIRKRWVLGAVTILLGLAVAGYEIRWWSWIGTAPSSVWMGPEMSGNSRSVFVLAGGATIGCAVLAFTGICGILGLVCLFKKGMGLFRRTLLRSLWPILASAVIVVAVLCGGALARWSRRQPDKSLAMRR